MANAQLMEEELQQSVVLSEEDAEFEEDEVMRETSMANTNVSLEPDVEQVNGDEDQQDHSDMDVDTYDTLPSKSKKRGRRNSMRNDGSLAVDEDSAADSGSEDDEFHEDDGAFDMDAEGEEEEGEDGQDLHMKEVSDSGAVSDAQVEEDVDEAEGVGAVKIKPGETDDDSDVVSSDSSASAFSDNDSIAEWDEAAENDDDGDVDEESDTAEHPICIFCKKSTGDDFTGTPTGDLVCKGCGEYAHSECARDEEAFDTHIAASNWKCPECAPDDQSDSGSGSDQESGNVKTDADVEGGGNLLGDDDMEGDVSPTSQRAAGKTESHSMFDQLRLDDDPTEGPRVLRKKRKTSSAEGGEVETSPGEDTMSLRKRRKNASDMSNQSDATQDRGSGERSSARPRSARSLRLKVSNNEAPCSIVKKTRGGLTLRMRVNSDELAHILSRKPKFARKRSGARSRASRVRRTASRVRRTASRGTAAAAVVAEASITTPFFSSTFSQPFYSFYDKETDESKGKPYGGILTEEQADTTKTLPTKDDRRRFDEAKQKAEEEWRNRLLAMQAESEVPVKKSKKTSGPVSQIECIEFGGWEIDTWYAAPYPEEYSRNRVLYICEFCLKYMNSDYVAWRHKLKCPAKHPPGDEIYRHGSISFFEVDGRKNPVYCQNLCLLAKLFLGSKTLYYDVEPFLFYVLCEYDDLGYHFVGYFSKEKRASSQNNVSCILTLPIHQRKGYGHLLIDFSYLLTRVEEKSGSPEKPLSDMGLVSYRNYWRLVLCRYLVEHVPEDKSIQQGISIRQISDDTGMTPDDVVSALEALRFLVRDPVTHVYAFRVDLPFCRKEVAKWEAKKYVKLNPRALTWTPYVMGRGNATNFELGPALNTIAPREDDEEAKPVELMVESAAVTHDYGRVSSPVRKHSLQDVQSVLESTEPNDDVAVGLADPNANGLIKENGGLYPPERADSRALSGNDRTSNDENDWRKQYDNIPISRFQVFPPMGRRPGLARVGSSIARPVALPRASTVRTPAQSRPRGRGRRPAGGASARKSGQKKNTTAKRKTGGTGRGPGRWPKGTKKSDYGNATSGPGLPPAWLEKQRLAAGSISVTNADEDKEMHDTVQVQVNETKGKKGKQVETVSTSFEVKSDILESAPLPTGSVSNGSKGNNSAGGDDIQDADALGEKA